MTQHQRTASRRCLVVLGMIGSLSLAAVAAAQAPGPAPPPSQAPAAKKEPRTEARPAKAEKTETEAIAPKLAERLTPAQQETYLVYLAARGAFENRRRAYWRKVEGKRAVRRAKRRARQDFTAEDYVTTFPPNYEGPQLPPEIARIIAEVAPPAPRPPLPSVADFLAQAKKQFGFVPRRASEREFKRSYAIEALEVGLTKDQVVRVYALETGGLGTYDMQSGTNPITRQGKPISSALGYAQLLDANSTGVLVEHGEGFARRLETMAAAAGTPPARATGLKTKAGILRKMLRAARSVPNRWSAHQRFAKTPRGQGIHALNLDAEVGPWMQVLKLKSLKVSAAARGRTDLAGAEIELMNLAGPGTGLEMMTPLGRRMPTPNFFSEKGYSRNPIVHGRTAAELLATLDARMEVFLQKAGSIEFARIFDEVAR